LLAQGLKVEAIHEAADLIRLARTGGIHGVIVGDDFGRQERIGVPALVRSEPDARHVAVISLLCDDDAGHVLELLRAGADEVLPAHAAPDVLAALCRHRVRRILDLAADRARDDRVGSLSQRHARLVIERMLLSAYQRRSSVSIGLISFDSAAMNDERSSAIADALAREFRRGDIVGRWSGRQFIVALQGVGRRTTARRLEDALRNLAVGNDSRAAVVEYPHDGQTLDDLVAAANALEQAARFDDGPRVVTADWRASGEMSADVLVVDPDATIRALMSSLFERNKLSVIQLNNGVAALEYLTSALDGALPRVMVMELDLMGIDGLQLLRRLRDGGVLGRMRVLVVTARIREGELVEALNLGASDVVTKPFSPALLVHRLRRVMEA
jgi:DNA-binding response OmpR family regulator